MSVPWDATKFWGSADAIGYALRDLPHLERAISRTVTRNVAVQAGANLGIFPKRLSTEFRAVYAFEPVAQTMRWAQRNAPELNVHYFQAVLGDSRQPVAMSLKRQDDKARPAHEGVAHVEGAGRVVQFRLDDWVPQIPECNLLCLDVEGYEVRVLRGAGKFLAAYRPVLMVEVHENHLGKQGSTPDELRAVLREYGYGLAETMDVDEVWLPRERLRTAA